MISKELQIIALAALTSSVVVAGDAYKAIDADDSGSISAAEATTLPGLTEQWKELDTDANGELSVEEFAKFEVPAPATPAPTMDTSAMETPAGL